ncbi:MAG: hypothetical protein R3357_14130 [Burkholderiales bacterium]|nr:hypothetical protein [Burkholderiales bacterium]
MLVGERGADDARVVLQLRRHELDLLRDGQARQELAGLAADPAADDDQVRPEVALQGLQVSVDAARPFLPRQVLAPAHARRSARLGFFAVELQVPEFRIRHQVAVDEQRRADSGAERDEDHQPRPPAAGPEGHPRVARGIGVVDDPPAPAGCAR